jgi:hypothetical protein
MIMCNTVEYFEIEVEDEDGSSELRTEILELSIGLTMLLIGLIVLLYYVFK